MLFLQYGANPQYPALHKLLARNDVLDQNDKQRVVSALQRESKQVEPYSKDGRLNIETSVSTSPPYHGYRGWNEDSSVRNPILSGPFRHKEQELLPGQHQSRVPCSCSMGLHALPDVFALGKRRFEQFHPHSQHQKPKERQTRELEYQLCTAALGIKDNDLESSAKAKKTKIEPDATLSVTLPCEGQIEFVDHSHHDPVHTVLPNLMPRLSYLIPRHDAVIQPSFGASEDESACVTRANVGMGGVGSTREGRGLGVGTQLEGSDKSHPICLDD